MYEWKKKKIEGDENLKHIFRILQGADASNKIK